jgi:hypothetical protein
MQKICHYNMYILNGWWSSNYWIFKHIMAFLWQRFELISIWMEYKQSDLTTTAAENVFKTKTWTLDHSFSTMSCSLLITPACTVVNYIRRSWPLSRKGTSSYHASGNTGPRFSGLIRKTPHSVVFWTHNQDQFVKNGLMISMKPLWHQLVCQ